MKALPGAAVRCFTHRSCQNKTSQNYWEAALKLHRQMAEGGGSVTLPPSVKQESDVLHLLLVCYNTPKFLLSMEDRVHSNTSLIYNHSKCTVEII